MSMWTRPAAALVVAALTFGCSDDSGDEDTGAAGTGGGAAAPVSFAADIHPILQMKCGTSGCHDGAQEPILPGHGAADVQHAYEATQKIEQSTGQPVYERILARITSTNPSEI